MENPFIVASMRPEAPVQTPSPEISAEELHEPVQIPDQTTIQTSSGGETGTQSVHDPLTTGALQQPMNPGSGVTPSSEFAQLSKDESLLLSLQQKMEEFTPVETDAPPEKVRLQKLHRLFEWTNKMVKKYGHDRLEIMIESYRTMGYISDDSYQQVNDIARLMPESLGESHEISSDEFVSELYVLNRILSPRDSSLDRDMIEVLMDMRAGQLSPDESSGKPKNKMAKDEWIDMLDRI